MKQPLKKSEILVLLGICLLILLPIGLIHLSQRLKALRAVPAPQAYEPMPPRLSPDGLYAATMEEAPLVSTADAISRRVLLVLRVKDKKVVSQRRVTASGENLAWSSDSKTLATWSQDNGQIWTRDLSHSPMTPFGGRFFAEDLGNNGLEVDQENDRIVQVDPGSGLTAYRISTGKPIPVRNTWHPNDSFPLVAMAPSALQNHGKKLLIVTSEAWLKYVPTPTPKPLPVSTPVPLTKEQQKFTEEEARMSEEVSEIVGKLQGEEPLSDEETRQLEARAKKLNRQISEGRARLFPIPIPTSTPVPHLTADDYYRVTMRDLKTGVVLWTRQTRSTVMNPKPLFSPDGSALLLLGQPLQKDPAQESNHSLEVLDPLTGHTRFMLETDFDGVDDAQDTQFFLAGHLMFAYLEWDGSDTLLHIKDLSDGHEVSKWSLKAMKPLGITSFQKFSCDASGKTWAFATENQMGKSWGTFSRTQMESQNREKPLPQPTQ